MKEIIKFVIILEILVVIIWGIYAAALKLSNQECPLIVLPLTMATVLACVPLAALAAWLEDRI